MMYMSYEEIKNNLTNSEFERRQDIAFLAASVLKEKFDHLINIGQSFATRVQFRNLISQDQWTEAIKILDTIPQDFPFIEKILLLNPEGTLMADTPQLSGTVPKDFALTDWYQEMSKNWKPNISGVYKRNTQPQYNVIAVTIPIKSNEQQILGILVMQIRLETLLDWSRSLQVGPEGLVYFVDKNGFIAFHEDFSPQGDIVNFSKVEVVQKALQGKRGIEIIFNPTENEERIAAYEPVINHGWGVVVTQPTATAFASQKEHLKVYLLAFSLVFILSILLASALLYLRRREHQELKLKENFLFQTIHSLRSPSVAINFILEKYDNNDLAKKFPDMSKDIQMIKEANHQMNRLIQYLFEIAKGERKEIPIKKEDVNIQALIEEIVQQYRPIFKKASVTFQYKEKKLPIIQGDKDVLDTIFRNIIDNAIKYNKKSGNIALATAVKGKFVEITIGDTGRGIPANIINKLFTPYFRGDVSTEIQGTGLGLYITKKFLEKMKGIIKISSRKGKGTKVIIKLLIS